VLDTLIDNRPFPSGTPRLVLIGAAALLLLICLRWPQTLVAFGLAAAAVGVFYAAWYTRHHPRWLVLALLLNEAFASVNFLDESLRPVLRYSMLTLFCVPMVTTAIRSGLLKQGGFKLYLVYFAWGLLTVTYSIYPVYSLGRLTSAALLLSSIVAVVSTIESDSETEDVIRIFWIGSLLIMGALAISLFALPGDVTWQPDDNGLLRFAGIFSSPNQVGEVMLTTVASGILFWPAARGRTRLLIALSIVAALGFDILADSRSPLIALCVGGALLGINRYGLRAIAVIGAVFGAILLLSLSFESGREYMMRGDVSSLTGRTDIWRYVVHAIRERPVLGWGYEVEGQIFQNRDFPFWEQIWNEGPRSSLHNGYLSRAIGVGIPATLVWLFIIARALGFAIFNRDASPLLKRAALIGAVPVMILNLVESTAGDCRYSVGLLLALVWCLSERARLQWHERDLRLNDSGLLTGATANAAGIPRIHRLENFS
jgi:hypothetical protein